MTKLTDRLPAAERQRLHADFLENEQAYLAMRAELLRAYAGKWVAVHAGRVVAHGERLSDVLDVTSACPGHPFIARVDAEDEPAFRVRVAAFDYDRTYQPFPLPRVSVAFQNYSGASRRVCDDVIPDTGADLSVLPDPDCRALDLYSSPYLSAMSCGVFGPGAATLGYRAFAELGGRLVPALIQSTSEPVERIIGRDVLNHFRVTFDGPAARVLIDD